jgi:hypothetical protein
MKTIGIVAVPVLRCGPQVRGTAAELLRCGIANVMLR